jgi:predicted acylesterase/phospholipase RssA
MNSLYKKNIAVFTGGGSRGVAQLGMYKAALDSGISFDGFVGASAGALNSAALSIDPGYETIEKLYNLYRNFNSGVNDKASLKIAKFLLTGKIGNEKKLDKMLSFIDGRKIEGGMKPLVIVTTRLKDLESVSWDRGDLKSTLLASTAIPGVYPPVLLEDGFYHTDGGVSSITPLSNAYFYFKKCNYYLFDVTSNYDFHHSMSSIELLRYISAKNSLIESNSKLKDYEIKEHIKLPKPFSEIDPLKFEHSEHLLNIGYMLAKYKFTG